MTPIKSLQLDHWPSADRLALERAYDSRDIFDDAPAPDHSGATRSLLQYAYSRYLGFLIGSNPDDLETPAVARITMDKVGRFVAHLRSDVRTTTAAHYIASLASAARLMFPETDWSWLTAIGRRLLAQSQPLDRFQHLVPGPQ